MDAGQPAHRIARITDIARWKAKGAGLPQQLAEDDLGVAAVHELWEQITDNER